MLQCTTQINTYTNRNLPSSRIYSGARSYCSVHDTSTRTQIGTCNDPDYILGRDHIVVYIIMSTNRHLPSSGQNYGGVVIFQCTTYIKMLINWHLPSSRLYSGARAYCSVHHYVLQSASAVIPSKFQGKVILQCTAYINTYTNWHLLSSRLYSGRRHIVVYIIPHQHAHQLAPAVISNIFRGKVIIQWTSYYINTYTTWHLPSYRL